MFAVLQRGRDNAAVYSALEAYALLGGAELLLPFQRQVFDGLARSMTALASELTVACEPPQPPKPGEYICILGRCRLREIRLAEGPDNVLGVMLVVPRPWEASVGHYSSLPVGMYIVAQCA